MSRVKEPKRGLRRLAKERMKRRARAVFSGFRPDGYFAGTPIYMPVDHKANEKLADHIKVCSGPCCGNPRRWFGELTMQERRARDSALEPY